MRALASGLIVRFFAVACGVVDADLVVEPPFLVAAQRARCASAIRARASGLRERLPLTPFLVAAGAELVGAEGAAGADFAGPAFPKRSRISAIALSISVLRCSIPSNAYWRRSSSV